MERFVVGDIIVISFPFTDFSSSRKRPALVLANLEGDDIVICEITSVIRKDAYAVQIGNKDLESGKLKINSTIRPNRILTIHKNKAIYKFGRVQDSKFQEVLEKVKRIFNLE